MTFRHSDYGVRFTRTKNGEIVIDRFVKINDDTCHSNSSTILRPQDIASLDKTT